MRRSIYWIAVFGFVFFYQKLSAQQSSCWNNYRGNPALTGTTPAALPEDPALAWTFKTGDAIKAAPVACNNVIVCGSVDGNVYGISYDGRLKWKIQTGNGIEAPALIRGNVAYIGNLSGEVFAIDIQSGNVIWTYETENSIMGAPNFAESGVSRAIVVGSYDYYLHGINPETGEGLWKYEADNYINGTPAVAKGQVFFGGCDGLLHVVNPVNGKLIKRLEVASYVAGSAAIDGNRAFLGDYDGKFSCIDLESMKPLWEFSNTQKNEPFIASPSVTSDKVFIGGRDKFIYAFDRKTGSLIWKLHSGGQIEASTVVAGNRLLAATLSGDLFVLNPENGDIIWEYELGVPVWGNPAVPAGMIIVAGGNGQIFAFK